MLTVTVLFLSSCSKDVIRGKGSTGTKVLNVPAFTAVETHYNIAAVISYGAAPELTVTGYNNLLDIIDFKVENKVLKLKFNTQYNNVRNGNVVADIKLPALASATIHGSGDISINNFSGTDTIYAQINGSGNINVQNSNYHTALTNINGSGNINARGLTVKEAVANVNGSGDISITVADKLKASIFGSGNICYWGNPLTETVRQGSGRVIKK